MASKKTSNRQTGLQKAQDYLRVHGIARTIHRCGYSVIKRCHPYMTMNCIWADAQKLNVPAEKLPYVGRFLTRAELRRYANDPVVSGAGLSEELIAVLMDHGDECFGILDGRRLAAFCWYCTNPPARINDLWALEFAPGCVYVYFVYTAPEYRGQRLLAHGIGLASREYLQRGHRNILAFVEWANYSSLTAFFRMGFQQFGRMRLTRLLGKTLVQGGDGCERFDFRVVSNPRPLHPRVLSRTPASAD
jgi:GNAT superfamily N-acetyltransferase